MSTHDIPADLRYTAEHEWVRVSDGVARIGITDYAQDALGDVVFVQVPDVGASVEVGSSM
ncbi:MAG TPA: glycine cleavage system protein H, partial [Actinomycetales bacterium]